MADPSFLLSAGTLGLRIEDADNVQQLGHNDEGFGCRVARQHDPGEQRRAIAAKLKNIFA